MSSKSSNSTTPPISLLDHIQRGAETHQRARIAASSTACNLISGQQGSPTNTNIATRSLLRTSNKDASTVASSSADNLQVIAAILQKASDLVVDFDVRIKSPSVTARGTIAFSIDHRDDFHAQQ